MKDKRSSASELQNDLYEDYHARHVHEQRRRSTTRKRATGRTSGATSPLRPPRARRWRKTTRMNKESESAASSFSIERVPLADAKCTCCARPTNPPVRACITTEDVFAQRQRKRPHSADGTSISTSGMQTTRLTANFSTSSDSRGRVIKLLSKKHSGQVRLDELTFRR